MTRCFALAVVLCAAACTHPEPFAAAPPDTVGPYSTGPLRRLTFNPTADVFASAIGDTVVFSRTDPGRADGDQCLALLPLEGGRLHRTACARGALADSVQDQWTQAAISPDRRLVALVRARTVVGSGQELSRALVVASLDAPDTALVSVAAAYPLPGGGDGNAFRRLTWQGNGTVRFLGGLETSGANASFIPAGVFEVAVGSGATAPPQPVAELAGALDYGVGDDGTVYLVTGTEILRWTPGAAATPVAQFDCLDGSGFQGFRGIAVGAGEVAALAECDYPDVGPVVRLFAQSLAGGLPRPVTIPFAPDRIAGVPNRPWIVVEAAGDLWLVALR